MRQSLTSISTLQHCWSYIASGGLSAAPNSRTLSSRIIDLIPWQQPVFHRLFDLFSAHLPWIYDNGQPARLVSSPSSDSAALASLRASVSAARVVTLLRNQPVCSIRLGGSTTNSLIAFPQGIENLRASDFPLAIPTLKRDGDFRDCVNLGNGNGFSVRQVIETAPQVTGQEIKVMECDAAPAILQFWSGVATKLRKYSIGLPNTQTSQKLSAMLGSGINGVINKVMWRTNDAIESTPATRCTV